MIARGEVARVSHYMWPTVRDLGCRHASHYVRRRVSTGACRCRVTTFPTRTSRPTCCQTDPRATNGRRRSDSLFLFWFVGMGRSGFKFRLASCYTYGENVDIYQNESGQVLLELSKVTLLSPLFIIVHKFVFTVFRNSKTTVTRYTRRHSSTWVR